MGMEIERKYLIRMPDEEELRAMPGCVVWDIVQTYLNDGGEGLTQRVRSLCCEGQTRYIYTFKRRIDALTCDEREKEISEEAYARLLREANPELRPIVKRRYRVPHAGQLMEIDIYNFWADRATLEIELKDEAEQPHIPDWLDIVREVTGENAYKNRYLAMQVPMEDIKSSLILAEACPAGISFQAEREVSHPSCLAEGKPSERLVTEQPGSSLL